MLSLPRLLHLRWWKRNVNFITRSSLLCVKQRGPTSVHGGRYGRRARSNLTPPSSILVCGNSGSLHTARRAFFSKRKQRASKSIPLPVNKNARSNQALPCPSKNRKTTHILLFYCYTVTNPIVFMPWTNQWEHRPRIKLCKNITKTSTQSEVGTTKAGLHSALLCESPNDCIALEYSFTPSTTRGTALPAGYTFSDQCARSRPKTEISSDIDGTCSRRFKTQIPPKQYWRSEALLACGPARPRQQLDFSSRYCP